MALIAWVSEARSLERAAEEEGRSSVGWICRAGVMLKSVSQYVSSPSQLHDKSGLRISDNYQFFGNTCPGVECPQMWGIATTVGKTVKSRRLKALHRLVITTPTASASRTKQLHTWKLHLKHKTAFTSAVSLSRLCSLNSLKVLIFRWKLK